MYLIVKLEFELENAAQRVLFRKYDLKKN